MGRRRLVSALSIHEPPCIEGGVTQTFRSATLDPVPKRSGVPVGSADLEARETAGWKACATSLR
jgi:hypothetical protein